jgi:hypothetical protein
MTRELLECAHAHGVHPTHLSQEFHMRKLPFNVPVFRQTPVAKTVDTQAKTRREPVNGPRELKSDELREVSGGAPGRRW